MRIIPVLGLLLATSACKGSIDLDVETPEELAELCEKYEPETRLVRVDVPANNDTCAWGQDGNLEPAQGVITARDEVYVDLELPDDIVVCDLAFEFQVDPEVEPEMVYDDHMYFLFNGVVLASSAGDTIENLPESGGKPVWDWLSLVGSGFDFNGSPWCLGQDEGRSNCTIPNPDTRQPILLDYDDALIDELSLLARQEERYQFGFVVFGDNDTASDGAGAGDCTHDAFSFDVEVPILEN